jgi:hypothetical protein
MDIRCDDRCKSVSPSRGLVGDGGCILVKKAKGRSRPQAGIEPLAQDARRLILDVDDHTKPVTRPIGERHTFLGRNRSGWGGNEIAVGIRLGMTEVIRKRVEVILD